MCIEATLDNEMKDMHTHHGGAWLYDLPIEQQQSIVDQCRNLPIILEIHHNNKVYGFVHADININDWEDFKQKFLRTIISLLVSNQLYKLLYGIEGELDLVNITLGIEL